MNQFDRYRMIGASIQFDPEGGELGRAPFGWITPLELQTVLPHVACILEMLWKLNNSRLKYCYAFEFNANCRYGIELVMKTTELPEHVRWYETDGKVIFEMRGASGGIVTNHICYLVTK